MPDVCIPEKIICVHLTQLFIQHLLVYALFKQLNWGIMGEETVMKQLIQSKARPSRSRQASVGSWGTVGGVCMRLLCNSTERCAFKCQHGGCGSSGKGNLGNWGGTLTR